MSAPDDQPNPHGAPARVRRRPAAIQVTAAIALAGVVLALVGAWVATRPVTTPLQDCGAAAAFLLEGRVNRYADPDAPPAGLGRDDVLDNNEVPCQERAANQARPGAVLAVAGTTVGVLAAGAEVLVRWRLRRRRQP